MLEKFKRIARIIGELRGEDWDIQQDDYTRSVYIAWREDSRVKFLISHSEREKRIKVFGQYPGVMNDRYPPHDQRPKEPKFGDERPEEQIARALCRQYIPELIEAIQEGYRLQDLADQTERRRFDMAKRLGDIIGVSHRSAANGNETGRVRGTGRNGVHVDLEIGHGGSVKVETTYLPLDLGEAVVRVLAAYTGEAQRSPGCKWSDELPPLDRVRAILERAASNAE